MDVLVYTCNPGTWEAETGRPQIQGLRSKFLSDKVKNCDRTIVLLLMMVITALTPCGGRWKYTRCVEVVIPARLMELRDVKQVLYLSLPIEGYVEPGHNIYFWKLVYKQGFLENVLILKITYIKHYLLKALKEQNCEVKTHELWYLASVHNHPCVKRIAL